MRETVQIQLVFSLEYQLFFEFDPVFYLSFISLWLVMSSIYLMFILHIDIFSKYFVAFVFRTFFTVLTISHYFPFCIFFNEWWHFNVSPSLVWHSKQWNLYYFFSLFFMIFICWWLLYSLLCLNFYICCCGW